jgi:hypothetical protein
MSDSDNERDDFPSEMTETQLGPPGAGLPPIPEPITWDSAYGIDEAVALAIVPNRALIFWELASVIQAGSVEGAEYRLIRMALAGDEPKRESYWVVEPIGRFQDSGVSAGREYLYVIARAVNGEEIPLMVTNPIRMPLLAAPYGLLSPLPSSIDLTHPPLKRALKEER